MCVCDFRTQLQRLLQPLARPFVALGGVSEAVLRLQQIDVRPQQPRQAVIRVEFDRLVDVMVCGLERRPGVLEQSTFGPQEQLVRVEVLRSALLATQLSAHQLDLQRLNDRVGDVVLHLEHVFQITVVGLRPQVIAVVGANELCGHPELIA